MQVDRDFRQGNRGIRVTIQTLDGVTHSELSENEALVGKLLDQIRIVVKETLVKLEHPEDGQISNVR